MGNFNLFTFLQAIVVHRSLLVGESWHNV